jgi:cytosine permease
LIGSGLIENFSLAESILVILVALGITWAGDAIAATIGGKTGRASTVIARCSFGNYQARMVVVFIVFMLGIGWWATQMAVISNATCTMLGIDYTTQRLIWAGITVLIGIIFALPAILGYRLMKWVDYLAVPAGLFILGIGICLVIQAQGLAGIWAWNPVKKIPWSLAISTIIGVNVCQWVMIADYSRYCKPKLKDTLLMPLGITLVGVALMIAGSVMSIGIKGFDIIPIMIKLGFPLGAFLLLWFAQWTSQMSNVYSPGLALSNMYELKTQKGRAIAVFFAALIGLILSLGGTLGLLQDFLLLLGIIYPPVGAIIATDFFILRKQKWKDILGWNWVATLAMLIGIVFGYYTQFINPIGIPAVQSYLITSLLYYVFMRAKGKKYPDSFTPKEWRKK